MQDLLNPEYAKALTHLVENLHSVSSVSLPVFVKSTVHTEGKFILIDDDLQIGMVPSGKEWRWNQTKGKKTVVLEDQRFIQFCKLNPRRYSPQNLPAPKYKLWLYKVREINENVTRTVLWCEKGETVVPDVTVNKLRMSYILN